MPQQLAAGLKAVTRVLRDVVKFHSTLPNGAYDALALEDALLMEKQESGRLAHLMMQVETLGLTSAKRVRGTVLVGSGDGDLKRQALDLALNNDHDPLLLPVRRQPYRQFMGETIHQLVRYRQDSSLALRDPVPYLVHSIARREGTRVLVLEDVSVTSVVDAMLLRRLFKGLFGYGMGIVLTSTRPPDEWYARGVNSQKFSAFRTLIGKECDVVIM